MSTIRVDNFGPSAGGTTYSARGIAKAWVNFNGTGTIAARDSENVSSLTDNGVGDYTVNLSNSFANANYASLFSCGDSAINPSIFSSSCVNVNASSVRTESSVTNAANVDLPNNYGVSQGDLA
jgi:hypothetical protein